MDDLKRIRGFYVYATAWDFDSDVQPHIEKSRRIQAEEFDSLLAKVKAEAWDEGYSACNEYQNAYVPVPRPNPYRKEN